jgi:hypothetical protein
MSMNGVWTYVAVVLFAVMPKICAVSPTVGSHCPEGTLASAMRAATRDSAACTLG